MTITSLHFTHPHKHMYTCRHYPTSIIIFLLFCQILRKIFYHQIKLTGFLKHFNLVWFMLSTLFKAGHCEVICTICNPIILPSFEMPFTIDFFFPGNNTSFSLLDRFYVYFSYLDKFILKLSSRLLILFPNTSVIS